MSDLERCPACAESRAKGEFEHLAKCRPCKGTGYRRKASSYVCNQCGEGLTSNVELPVAEDFYGLVDIKVSGGYASPHLNDGTHYAFSLCEKCLRSLFNGFTIKPSVDTYGWESDVPFTYEKDQQQRAARVWIDSGEPRAKFLKGLCNATEKCTKKAKLRHFVSGTMTDEAFCDEHAKVFTYGNSIWAPASELKTISLYVEHRNAYEKRCVADTWLRLTAKPYPYLTYHECLSGCLRDLLAPIADDTPAIWQPAAERPFVVSFGDLPYVVLPSGLLFYGPEARDVRHRSYTAFGPPPEKR
jgi:hypothetical protein